MKGIAFLAFLCAVFVIELYGVQSIAQSKPAEHIPVSISIYERARADTWQWFAAPPASSTYAYGESLLRIAMTQRIQHWDWKLELSQPTLFDLPSDGVAIVSAQGQLGLGGTYYASNGDNSYPAAAFLKQGFLRYHFDGADKNLRLGRFEFLGGQETHPRNATIAWLQSHRIAQRLVGNFGFTNGQRSFDGVDGHYGAGTWDVTAMAARADQGVFNMNGNPELNVALQYLAYTRSELNQHMLWRAFAIDYYDGRTGIIKTDNRPLAARQADHNNIRMGSYGGNFIASIPAGSGEIDALAWGVLQNGNWGVQSDSASAAAVEAGYRFSHIPTTPWLRGGWFRGSGDNNPTDNKHSTFFQMLTTPRVYARFPFYNLMNSSDQFVQIIDTPARRLVLRSDLHWLQLTSSQDLWYSGGGAFDDKVFGYTGRATNGHSSFATVADISSNWKATKNLAVNLYYAHASGKSAIASIYPTDSNAQFGYVELVYQWGQKQQGK